MSTGAEFSLPVSNALKLQPAVQSPCLPRQRAGTSGTTRGDCLAVSY